MTHMEIHDRCSLPCPVVLGAAVTEPEDLLVADYLCPVNESFQTSVPSKKTMGFTFAHSTSRNCRDSFVNWRCLKIWEQSCVWKRYFEGKYLQIEWHCSSLLGWVPTCSIFTTHISAGCLSPSNVRNQVGENFCLGLLDYIFSGLKFCSFPFIHILHKAILPQVTS